LNTYISKIKSKIIKVQNTGGVHCNKPVSDLKYLPDFLNFC